MLALAHTHTHTIHHNDNRITKNAKSGNNVFVYQDYHSPIRMNHTKNHESASPLHFYCIRNIYIVIVILFTVRRSIQDSKIHVDMDIVIYNWCIVQWALTLNIKSITMLIFYHNINCGADKFIVRIGLVRSSYQKFYVRVSSLCS